MQGNIQIFFRPKELPIWPTLSPAQLAFYSNLAISLLTPVWRLAYLLLPLLSLILGFTLIAAPPIEYAAYGLPFILLLHTLPSWLSDHHHYQFWNKVYETLFCIPGLKRMLQVLRHPFMIFGGIVTRKDAGAAQQSFNLGLSWPIALLLATLGLAILFRFAIPLALSTSNAWRPTYEGESLMISWNIYNGIVLAVTFIACIDRPIRRATDRFPIRRIGRLLVGGRELWGTTVDLSEEGAGFALQQPCLDIQPGEATLELMEPPLRLPARLVRAHGQTLALQFRSDNAATDAALISLIYDGSHWFHRPRRLSTIDAFLQWIGTLIRPDPILRRFSG